jgi:hypothetical protein
VTAPAPWTTRLHAVVWCHRATPEAAEALPPELRSGPRLPLTVGAFVHYLDTPVGPYAEVLASPAVLFRGRAMAASHIPFIAVDSEASVRGGRENWALPKTLARFALKGGDLRAEGPDWAVRASVESRGPGLPFACPARDVQIAGDDAELAIPILGAGVARAASVEVAVEGAEISPWLAAGRHVGVVLTRARVHFGVARRG